MAKKKEVQPSRTFKRQPREFTLTSRVNYSVRVTLANGDEFMLSPGETTNTRFKEGDVKFVDGHRPDSASFRQCVMKK